MTQEYAVKAENPEGVVVIIQRGFASKGEAEDHRVTMSKWKRVWIECIGTAELQAPHWAMPQPNLMPVSFNKSRSTHSKGVSGSRSTV
jgi:hypothetical protein